MQQTSLKSQTNSLYINTSLENAGRRSDDIFNERLSRRLCRLYCPGVLACLRQGGSQPCPCSSHVSDSTLPPPHRPSGRRLPNASLIWLAGGTAGGIFADHRRYSIGNCMSRCDWLWPQVEGGTSGCWLLLLLLMFILRSSVFSTFSELEVLCVSLTYCYRLRLEITVCRSYFEVCVLERYLFRWNRSVANFVLN